MSTSRNKTPTKSSPLKNKSVGPDTLFGLSISEARLLILGIALVDDHGKVRTLK